jgi:hypothetical protein
MSDLLKPTKSQYPVRFDGIDQITEEKPKEFTKGVAKNEYVAGGFYNKDLNVILYRQDDALLAKFGDGIVHKMRRDPEISKCEQVLKISVLGDGVTFFPALSKPAPMKPKEKGEKESIEQKRERLTREKEIERYELSEKYAKFATRAVENLDSSLRTILENMLDAIVFGNKIAEQTYVEKYDKEFGRELLTLSSIRVKSRKSTKFVLNKYRKLIGFQVPVKRKDEFVDIILPREKFLVLTFRGKDGDPRGTSILESVYNAWYLKMQVWPEYLRWLLQCAIPSLVGYAAPEGEMKTYLKNSNGDYIKDTSGNLVYEADTTSLLNALIQVRNATAIALPNGAKVEPITNQVSGDPFKGMIDVLNEEIEMGMILQTLATSEGKYMSRAASQSHLSILDLLVAFIKELVIDMLRNDVLKPLFTLNFENFDMELLPRVSMGDIERRDWGEDAKAIAELWKSGFMGESQKVGYDKLLTAPERDVESDRQLAKEQLEAENQATATGAVKPVPTKKTVAETLHGLVEAYELKYGEKLL